MKNKFLSLVWVLLFPITAFCLQESCTNTLNGVVRDVFLEQESCHQITLANEESPAFKSLMEMTTPDILSEVFKYVWKKKTIEELEITKENHLQFIAAAKIVDLSFPAKNQPRSTYQVRYAALKKADRESGMPYFSNAINAFSMPSADEQDPYFLNSLDNFHPDLMRMDPFVLLEYREKMNQYAEKQVNLHPEFVSVIEKVVQVFGDNVAELQSVITPPKIMMFGGTAGAGKSYFIKRKIPNLDLDTSIVSTDNIRDAISTELNKDFSNTQLFFLGKSLRVVIENIIDEKYITPSLIREGWLIYEADIAKLFKTSIPVEMYDFDGDLRLVAIRTILRARSPDGRPTFPWAQMTRPFKMSRQARPVTFASIQEKDFYQLQYSFNDGTVKTYSLEEAKNLYSKDYLESIDEEIASVAVSVITQGDVAQFGEALQEFEGMTISEAVEYAKHPIVKQKKSLAQRVTILFTGDTHSHLGKTQRIAQSILMEKQNPENGDVIVADVGDMLTGTEYFEVSKGALEFDMMNLAGYQIAAIGNHEFDAGWTNLKELMKRANFDIVNANIYEAETNTLIAEPYKIYTLASLKVAFVGIMGQDAWKSIGPSSKQGLFLKDADAVLDDLLPQLETEVDAIVLLSHSGVVADRQLAAKHIQLDAILGGHSHTFMNEPELVHVNDKQIPIFHSSSFAEYLGKFTFEVNHEEKKFSGQLIKLDASKDPQGDLSFEQEEIRNKLLSVSEVIEEIYSRIISTCVEPLLKDGIKKGVGPLGRDFICHIIKEVSGSDIAFYPTNGIRKSLEKGPIALRTIVNMVSYDSLVTYKIKGAALRQLMEDGETRWASGSRTFQTNGIEIYSSTGEIAVNGKPLQDDHIYRVSGPSFFFDREFFDAKGNVADKYLGNIDQQNEEYPDDIRTVIINWLENNDLAPYLMKHEPAELLAA